MLSECGPGRLGRQKAASRKGREGSPSVFPMDRSSTFDRDTVIVQTASGILTDYLVKAPR